MKEILELKKLLLFLDSKEKSRGLDKHEYKLYTENRDKLVKIYRNNRETAIRFYKKAS